MPLPPGRQGCAHVLRQQSNVITFLRIVLHPAAAAASAPIQIPPIRTQQLFAVRAVFNYYDAAVPIPAVSARDLRDHSHHLDRSSIPGPHCPRHTRFPRRSPLPTGEAASPVYLVGPMRQSCLLVTLQNPHTWRQWLTLLLHADLDDEMQVSPCPPVGSPGSPRSFLDVDDLIVTVAPSGWLASIAARPCKHLGVAGGGGSIGSHGAVMC